ncbi:LysE family translocator [Aliikangiella marina]|uniref:LysE family translocator n=2 Tax=Aliikangiella marina TaxID=1712262 RepID=A0A545TEI0_9GAMM|nr:LysE family translocator [Aliikangiella marina]
MSIMLDFTLLALFIPTFLVVSATPGMCMTLALTLGMSIGLRRTFWMMWGELIGVAIVSVLAVIGVAKIMLEYPNLFLVLKYFGGAYLIYIGMQMWRSKGRMAIQTDSDAYASISAKELITQGFIAAIANPKGWAFTISLLPPFINPEYPMVPQLSVLIAIILMSELMFMTLYASGGRTLRQLLSNTANVKTMNRVSGTLMIGVGLWLALG